jgi:nucleotide-binding universal stress UspA family protein
MEPKGWCEMTAYDEQVGHVVVGVDGSERGYAGVRYAVQEASWWGVPLDIVNVVPGYLPVGPLLMLPDGSLQAFSGSVIEHAAELAHEMAPELEVVTHIKAGGRVHELAEFAREARVLVVGARHLTVAEHIWTGATVTGVVSRSVCPVVVVPPTWEPSEPRGRVVVGYKSPQHCVELFDEAFSLADQRGAELVVLHAWKLPSAYDDLVAARVQAESWNAEEAARIETQLADCREAYPRVPARVEVVHERPVRALVEASRSADRLVLVKPAHGGYFHHLGSTARGVLRMSTCPVEVVPPVAVPEPITGLSLEAGGALAR